MTIAATEGAVAMSRAQRSREPFDTVAQLLIAITPVPTIDNRPGDRDRSAWLGDPGR